MAAKPLSDEQLDDAGRLRAILAARKEGDPQFTQEKLAFMCGWKTQGAVNQYVNGKIPLNLRALQRFSDALSVPLEDISPALAREVRGMANRGNSKPTSVSDSNLRLPDDLVKAFLSGGDAKKAAMMKLSELPDDEMNMILMVLNSIGEKYKQP